MLLEGLFVPLTTPFYPDGRLYVRKLEHNVERYSRTPAAGLALLTPFGEGALLTDQERLSVLRTAVEVAAKDKVLLADCSCAGVSASLELLHAVSELGYDAALLRYPAALETLPSAEGTSRSLWLRTLADRTPLPLVLAEDRGPDSGMPMELLQELARAENVLGWVCAVDPEQRIPEMLRATAAVSREVVVTPVFAAATRRMLHSEVRSDARANYVSTASLTAGGTALAMEPPRPALRTRTRQVGFQVLAGETRTLAGALRAGARGAFLPLAACAPQAAYEVLAAWKDDDQMLLADKAARLSAAARIEEVFGCAGVKTGCDRNGYFGGRTRLPLAPLRAAEISEVETLLRGMRN